MMRRLAAALLIAVLLAGCSGAETPNASLEESEAVSVSEAETASSEAEEKEPEGSEESAADEPEEASEEESWVAIEPSSPAGEAEAPLTDGEYARQEAGNPFALDPAGSYELYAYHADLMGYVNLGNAYWTTHQVLQPELEAAIAAINALPALDEVGPASGFSPYGLMTVATDGSYAKTQFFLRENTLAVDGVAYAINAEQYAALRQVMEAGRKAASPVPHWFAYMNPGRVTGIECTNEKGEMQAMKPENVRMAAAELRYQQVTALTTYTPGSKNLEDMPFKAVYTFDNGGTYTVYVSDVTPRTPGVKFYVEATDMEFACEYTSDGYISSNYVESTQGMLEGPANPRTM